MSAQWFRCFFGMHKTTVLSEVKVTNVRGEEVGKNYVSVCENCGHISSKFISNKIEELRRY
jgi:hypothetical protein